MKKDDKFIEWFENRVSDTIRDYDLIRRKDKVIVACSGGKDSMAVLYLMKKFGYDVEALTIDLLIGDWSLRNRSNVRKFSRELGIKVHEVNIRDELGHPMSYIRSAIQSKVALNNCTICGIIKRWMLNKKARQIKGAKIATGHNLDDEAQTLFMNLMKGNPKLSVGLGPKTGVMSDKMFVQRVKPLYFLLDEEIRKYAVMMKFPVLYDPCPCSSAAFRRDILNALDGLDAKYPGVKHNIVDNFLKLKPVLVDAYGMNDKDKGINYCSECGEPTRNEVCKACELFAVFKK